MGTAPPARPGRGDADNLKGIRGVAGGCSLLAVRIAYSNGPNSGWVTTNGVIARAVDWAWQHGADVLSNSWGGGAPSNAIILAFERARILGRQGKGCVIVVAAGNGSGPVSFPAKLPNVLAVSATNEKDEFKTKTSSDGEYWWGSNFGPEVDISAPGVQNYTTDHGRAATTRRGHYYSKFNGTSSSTPLVAGAAALLLSANPGLTEARVRQILCSTAIRLVHTHT
ncbi:S8 family serine peptidase [Pseudoduganella sp. UC29_106]|uniref:S8 family serine peptidase n=1 Tax=Pseudoduganella sp. UC29_106 TaxID=3374553 RepID=UPI003757F25F